MTIPRILAALPAVCLLVLAGCDKGLAPPAPEPWTEFSGFSGVLHFQNWPPLDSVQELRVVAFRHFPSDSSSILQLLISGEAVVYPPIGAKSLLRYGADTISYVMTTDSSSLQVGTYEYVVVAQKYGSNIFTDWKPAGLYTKTIGSFDRAPVEVVLHRITPGLDIYCDFHNPPPKPWL
jgi:hypothetical protein